MRMSGCCDYYPHFTNRKTELKTEVVSCQASQSYLILEQELKPRSPPDTEEGILNDSVYMKF